MFFRAFPSCLIFFFFLHFAFAGEGHLGEIRYSILNLEQFRQKYGSEWELMKGQSIPEDSELFSLFGKDRVPDARGVFLRCSQQEREDEKGNPTEGLAVGDYQQDSFKVHNHGGGNHHHYTYFETSASRNPHGGCCNTVAVYHHQSPVKSTDSGDIIHSEGGSETRPRCVIVNAFIKMKESDSGAESSSASSTSASGSKDSDGSQKKKSKLTEHEVEQMTRHPLFRSAVEDALRTISQQRSK